MPSNCKPKLNIFFLLVVSRLTYAITAYTSANAVNGRETSPQTLYAEIPQEYLLALQKYIAPTAQKYVSSRPESQIPIAVTPTEKTVFTPAYKLTLDTSKYVPSQVTKPVAHVSKVSYPYLYTIAKAVPSTVATYTAPSSVGGDITTVPHYHTKEIPKKYQYGYRVSNPHTGTEFGHSEVNDGLSAKGYYHVLLPDGRLQNVKYWAGPSGYHATITYETQY